MKVFSNNLQVDAYLTDRNLKHHEQQMIELVRHRCGTRKPGRWLDMGCADALFLKTLSASFSDWEFTGLEINDALLARARININEDQIPLIKEDASTYAS